MPSHDTPNVPSVDAVRQEMDERYRDGQHAYVYEMPWDIQRRRDLVKAAADCMLDSLSRAGINRQPPTWPDHYRLYGKTLLDLGCGLRSVFEEPAWLDVDFFGVTHAVVADISEEAVRTLRDQRKAVWKATWKEFDCQLARHDATLSLHAAPAECLPLMDKSIDAVVSIESIEHWSDVGAGLREVHRVLSDKGVFVLTTPNREALHVRIAHELGVDVPFCSPDHTHEFGLAELDNLLFDHGFRKVSTHGAGFSMTWGLEALLGTKFRAITDTNARINQWLGDIGRASPEFAFCQVKGYVKC